MTPDHLFLVAGIYGQSTEVFKHDGSQFNKIQSIDTSAGAATFVSITDDHQFLTITSRTE